jgi:diguanylate cyclase (GGDEF)-like protein
LTKLNYTAGKAKETVNMTSMTRLQPLDTPPALETELALSLVQAFHRHLEVEAVIGVLWSRGATLIRASGLCYRHPGQGLEVQFGSGRHTASYDLAYQGETLGEVVFHFQRRVDEATLAVAESLVSLAVPALRNALAHRAVLEAAEAPPPAAGSDAAAANGAPASDDALVLVALDGHDEVRVRHGDTWADTLVQSVQEQIREGLRDADSVFQIGENLLAVLLPHTTETAALDVAAKIRVLIAGLHLKDGRLTSQLTACMGVTGARRGRTPGAVLALAREALERARREGPNAIRAYRETGSSG